MLSEQLKEKINGLIAKNRIEEAIQFLLEDKTVKRDHPSIHKEILILSADWAAYKNDIIEGIKSDEALKRQYNAVTRKFVNTIYGEKPEHELPHFSYEKTKNVQINPGRRKTSPGLIIAGLAVIILVAFIVFLPVKNFIWGSSYEQEPETSQVVMRKYKLLIYDWPAKNSTGTWALNVYDDYSGLLVQGKNKYRVDKFNFDEQNFLSFEVSSKEGLISFNGIRSITTRKLEGGIFFKDEKVGSWNAEQLK